MFNFEELKKVSNKSQDSIDKRMDKFNHCYLEAMDYIKKFENSKSHDKDFLIKASDKLLECVSIKSSEPNPHIYLAYVAFVLDDIKLTHKYLSTATYLDPNSELLKKFKTRIASLPLKK